MADDLNALWDDLLEYIDAGLVLPIIGQDLASVSIDGREARLYDHLATRLAKDLGVEMGPTANGFSLSDVAGRYVAQGGRKLKIHLALHKMLQDPKSFPVPNMLLKLAAIEKFTLIVTTTFDLMLERALNEVRFAGKDKTASFAYSPDDTKDITEGLENLDRPTVFHLLGRLSPKPHCAVTEDDVLEFVHRLQENTQTRLFDELREKELLFIGCAFPDWLTRFLIRTARGMSLQQSKTSLLVADQTVRADAGLVYFLEHFSNSTRVFPGTAAEFVTELHYRWTSAHGMTTPVSTAGPAPETTEKSAPEGAVFLSYASEDLDAARAIRDALERKGVDVWFDKDDLEGGDQYRIKIRQNIGRSSLFVPIISEHTTTEKRRFFRREWNEALDEAKEAAWGSQFLVPVVIDDTSYGEETVPDAFRAAQWIRLPEGKPTDELVTRIVALVRKYNKGKSERAR